MRAGLSLSLRKCKCTFVVQDTRDQQPWRVCSQHGAGPECNAMTGVGTPFPDIIIMSPSWILGGHFRHELLRQQASCQGIFWCGWASLRQEWQGGMETSVRTLECFVRGCENYLFAIVPNTSSHLVLFVYYNLIFCNISGRNPSFPSTYSILRPNSV